MAMLRGVVLFLVAAGVAAGPDPADCKGGGNNVRIAPISCPGGSLFNFGGQPRNCCESTGTCTDSSCVVFGYDNSAKANCPGKWGKCDLVKCKYNAGCVPGKKLDGYCTKLSNQCYGTVTCVDPSKCNAASLGADLYAMVQAKALCLEDGGSDNFKICGDGPVIEDPPFGGTGLPVCTQCEDVWRTKPCQDVVLQRKGWWSADIPGCRYGDLEDILIKYRCTAPVNGCTTYVCLETIPDEVIASVTNCAKSMIKAD